MEEAAVFVMAYYKIFRTFTFTAKSNSALIAGSGRGSNFLPSDYKSDVLPHSHTHYVLF